MRRLVWLIPCFVTACANDPDAANLGSTAAALECADDAVEHGEDLWFHETFGGEKFFAMLAAHPDPTKRIKIGFDAVATTPRADRFAVWGVVNDPDCEANPAGGFDVCPDPEASGVVGIRKFPGPGGTNLFGVACAACHAGFDPLNPPANPAEPSWDEIHPTIGNQHLKFGKIFSHNMAATDVRRLIFLGWPDGTVDTTLLFDDHIMNPGVVTAFWEQPDRRQFHIAPGNKQLRNGQGGEDDVGGPLAATRVYTNIGVCFAECVAPRPDRPDPTAPIDLDQCRADCADFPSDEELEDVAAFMASARAPLFPDTPSNKKRFKRGKAVFEDACSSCHRTEGKGKKVLSDDEVQPLAVIGTNACRALTTNWDAGEIWAAFSSDVYKTRGYKGYRTMPLTGVWATAPFLHNQSIGAWAPATATPTERAAVYEAAMAELLSDTRTPKINVLPFAVGPFPAGTPLTYLFSRDPATGTLLCDDVVENKGHTFGSALPADDKEALIYWLKYQ